MKKNPKPLSETEMYAPIKDLLASQGFNVKGEVNNCDIAAERDGELWVVEMKLHFNIKLLYQAIERMKITPYVFIAVPKPKRINNKDFATAKKILKKLELGLITVSFAEQKHTADIIFFPCEAKQNVPVTKSQREKTALVINEMDSRIGDTAGGSTKTKINTAYRERVIEIACCLREHGEASAAQLKNIYGCMEKTYSALRANYYGWFINTKKGVYALNDAGRMYLDDNAGDAAVAYYGMRAKEAADVYKTVSDCKK